MARNSPVFRILPGFPACQARQSGTGALLGPQGKGKTHFAAVANDANRVKFNRTARILLR